MSGFELAIIIVLVLMGASIVRFAPQIGTWMSDFDMELRRGLSKTGKVERPVHLKWWRFSPRDLAFRFDPSYSIWLTRIIGIGFLAGAGFLLVGLLLSG